MSDTCLPVNVILCSTCQVQRRLHRAGVCGADEVPAAAQRVGVQGNPLQNEVQAV